MRRISILEHLFLFCCAILLAMPGMTLPKYTRTTLPIPWNMEESDRKLAIEALNLEVYQDSDDPNQYYYIPPFHIRQYTRGAAGMVLNSEPIKEYAAAKNVINERLNFDTDKISELRTAVEDMENEVEIAFEKYEAARETGNEQLIAFRQELLNEKRESLKRAIQRVLQAEETIRSGESLLPLNTRITYNARIRSHLGGAGYSVPFIGGEDPDTFFTKLVDAATEASKSYGGFLSVNAYAGFTKQQLEALITFKTKYNRGLKVSLMPVEKLTFFGLTEWQVENQTAQRNSMFRQINGSGDYLGAAIVMDTTITGSMGLAEHLAPFVLPVGIRASLKQQLLPAEAVLDCDFSNGFSVKGRADVRDGLIIYDNDITNTIKAEDSNLGACNLQHISGDVNSAEYAALVTIEQTYNNMLLRRTELSRSEKDAYFRGVLEDIQNNRREEEPHYKKVIRQFNSRGWQEIVVEGLSRAADFHWHTNIQDVSNISKVKFTKKLSVKGHKTAELDLPTNLCLVYNSQIKAYDRCTEVDEDQAKNMQAAMKDAIESEPCQNASDPIDCGKQRDAMGYTHREPQAQPDDTNLVRYF